MIFKRIWILILPLLKNKYALAIIIFLGWVFFFDQNNQVEQMKNLSILHQFEKDKLYYTNKIKEDSTRLTQLRTNTENLEKFAREQYLMKKQNEDVFIIIKEKNK
jgi:cell division protein DivIC